MKWPPTLCWTAPKTINGDRHFLVKAYGGKNDKLTAQSFDKYSDAYDLLAELYGDLCCSDADYGDINYYDIVDNN